MAANSRSLTRGPAAHFLLAWLALAGLPSARAQTRAEGEAAYEKWLSGHRNASAGPFLGQGAKAGQRLVVTEVEGDDKPPQPDPFESWSEYAHGLEVSKEGAVSTFAHSSRGSRGGSGGPPLAEAVLARVDELLVALPEDGMRLPPAGRRLLVQGTVGEKSVTRVYDRANAPESLWELLRLVGSSLGSYVPEFRPQSQIDARGFEHDGFLALAPDGKQLLFTGMNQPLQVWSAASHELLAEVRGLGDRHIALSPDGAQAVLVGSGIASVVETGTWKALRKLPGFLEPVFLPDGRHVLLSGGTKPLQIYEVATGKSVPHLPEIPEGAVRYLPAPKSHRAVVQLTGGKVVLWDAAEHRALATLRENAGLAEAVFSPDESLLVTSTHTQPPGWQITSFGLWRADTGALVHELRPFERAIREETHGLLWSPDGEYVLAGVAPDAGSNNIICIFSAKTGRHRGQLANPRLIRLNGVVLLPDGSELVAGCVDGKIRFWDFPAAMKGVREFEKTLAAGQ